MSFPKVDNEATAPHTLTTLDLTTEKDPSLLTLKSRHLAVPDVLVVGGDPLQPRVPPPHYEPHV